MIQFLTFLIVALLSAGVYLHHRKKRVILIPSYMWFLLCLFFPFFALPTYLVMNVVPRLQTKGAPSPIPAQFCPKCGQDNAHDAKTCSSCQNVLTL